MAKDKIILQEKKWGVPKNGWIKFVKLHYAHCKCLQGITGTLQGKSAIPMEKGCKNHRETLYSSKGKIAYTARPQDTRPQGVRTLEIHGF